MSEKATMEGTADEPILVQVARYFAKALSVDIETGKNWCDGFSFALGLMKRAPQYGAAICELLESEDAARGNPFPESSVVRIMAALPMEQAEPQGGS